METSLLQGLLDNQWVNLATAVVAFCAAVSAIFPSKLGKDTWFGKCLQFVLDVFNFAGFNIGKAKNADDE